MPKNRRTPSRNWFPYLEALIIILFIALMIALIRNDGAQSEPLPVSRAREFINQADQDFAKQDLGRAALAYWEAIRIIESAARDGNAPTDELDNDLLHANLRVAEIYQHSSWIKDARNRLERAAKIQPHHVDVRLLRGKLARDDADTMAVANELLAVIEKDSSHAEAHYMLGVLYQQNKQFEDAIAHYKAAIESDAALVALPFEPQPIGLQARLQLARTYRRMLQDYRFIDREVSEQESVKIGEIEDAVLAVLEQAVEISPDFSEAKDELVNHLVSRAAIVAREGDTRPYDEALKLYERVVKLDPTRDDIWKRIGEIYAHFMDDKEAALKAYKAAYQLKPDLETLAIIETLQADVANNGGR